LLAACVLFAGAAFASPAPPAAIPRPTHLRPVQSKADCTTLAIAALFCDTGVRAGDLQLLWDDSDKAVTGYKVYQLNLFSGARQLLGTAARYFLVKKPRSGYTFLCFVVQASTAKGTSADSARYCYAPGATATTRSFQPSHAVTQVTWNAPVFQSWSGGFALVLAKTPSNRPRY